MCLCIASSTLCLQIAQSLAESTLWWRCEQSERMTLDPLAHKNGGAKQTPVVCGGSHYKVANLVDKVAKRKLMKGVPSEGVIMSHRCRRPRPRQIRSPSRRQRKPSNTRPKAR